MSDRYSLDSLDWGIPSKAVIACDGSGQGCVLYTAGPHVAMDMHEIGRDLADLGLDDAPAGLSVWEGTTGSRGSGEDTETWLKGAWLTGAFRTPTDDEWAAIQAGRCPWDETAWQLVPNDEAEIDEGEHATCCYCGVAVTMHLGDWEDERGGVSGVYCANADTAHRGGKP